MRMVQGDGHCGESLVGLVSRRRKNSGGTASTSQTPLAERKKVCPAWCMAAASTTKMTGLPRRPHLGGGVAIRAEVNVLTRHFSQALFQDRLLIVPGRTVEEQGRGLSRFELQIDLDAMALVGADLGSGFVEGKPLLIVGLHHLIQLGSGNREALLRHAASNSSTDTQPPGSSARPSRSG